MPETIPEKTLREMVEKVKETSDMVFGVIGYKSTLTFENLRKMEEVINSMYPQGHDPMPTTVIPFGVHVGEVLIKHIPGAKWNFDEPIEYVYDLSITCPGPNGAVAKVKPLQRVAKFWRDRTDTIFGFAEMIRDMANGTLNPTKEGKWVKRPNGTQIRVHSMTKDATEDDWEKLRMKMGKVVSMETWNKHKDQ